jgi:septal ring factor EnvC (AmiA/AmiB activator)
MKSKILAALLAITLISAGVVIFAKDREISALTNLNESLKQELEAKSREKINFEAALTLQSAKIKQFEVDLESSKKKLTAQNSEIAKKYQSIKTHADTCESKLAAIEKITEAFHAKD